MPGLWARYRVCCFLHPVVLGVLVALVLQGAQRRAWLGSLLHCRVWPLGVGWGNSLASLWLSAALFTASVLYSRSSRVLCPAGTWVLAAAFFHFSLLLRLSSFPTSLDVWRIGGV